MNSILILGGELKKSSRIKKYTRESSLVVAADHGAQNALKLGIIPDHVVGDLDSLSAYVKSRLKAKSRFHRYPSRKDFSDAELALQFILSKKPTEIIIIGALGKRIDHAIANLMLLTQIPEKILACIMDEGIEIFYVRNIFELKGKKGNLISILPLLSHRTFLKTSGLSYGLNNKKLRMGAHGLSNRMVKSTAMIEVKEGAVFVFHYI